MGEKGYILNRHDKQENMKKTAYVRTELELMTTFQLREICRKEKLIHGVINTLDKEELIHVILRYCGETGAFLIQEYREEGFPKLEEAFRKCKKIDKGRNELACTSKITSYEGLAIGVYDTYTIPYRKELTGTNALIVSGENTICGILNLVQREGETEHLYLVKNADLPCYESKIKNYTLYCMDRHTSEQIYQYYYGKVRTFPEHLSVYMIPLLDFEVKKPIRLSMPLAIDFGSTNTTAGVYLDSLYFEQAGNDAFTKEFKENDVNYTLFDNEGEMTALFPSVVGVVAVEGEKHKLLFGYEAMKLAESSYIDEGFCVFYDIKRWVSDYEKVEEIIDRQGRRAFVKRRDIVREFFLYIIEETRNRFKCEINEVHISSPVKQTYRFQKMFTKILPEYGITQEEMLDEGIAVLYNTLSSMMDKKSLEENKVYDALIIDCGGGTTDLCSCRFQIKDKRVAYRIQMETAYENGDTDFGGNNLTYRIMQLIKITLANKIGQMEIKPVFEILEHMDMDVYRYIDQHGIKEYYKEFQEEYEKAEMVIPTRFLEYEKLNRADYYKVKNNFYTLFFLAEQVKKQFYNKIGTLQIQVSTETENKASERCVRLDKWKLSIREGQELHIKKNIPDLELNIFEMELLLKGEIYGIIHKFMDAMYESGRINQFSFIKLTGQSCKIDLFKDALKEFVPGKMIQFKRRTGDLSKDYDLKMTCVDGALKYLRDKRYGFAEVEIKTKRATLPYVITAFTHNGQEVELLNGFGEWDKAGTISRNLENLTLQMYLKDNEGNVRYQFRYECRQEEFISQSYEQIQEKYGEHILQKATDMIMNGEVKFFVWAIQEEWGYIVVPVYRQEEVLHLGREQFYSFENDSWVHSFFDGTK